MRTKGRLFRESDGFTLPEVLVAMVMMLTVMFALYSIFDMSLRVFSFGNDRVEATENARLGVERMEREIRAAYPQDDDTLLTTSDSDEIAFDNRSGDDSNTTTIAYELYSSGSGEALGRSEDGGDNQPVAESAKSLEFSYLDENGNETDEESEIVRVRIMLEIDAGGDGGDQSLTTDVALRNRS